MSADESRKITMDLIDRLHGIFIIRDSFCLGCCVDLFLKAKGFGQCLVRIVPVMDDCRPRGDDADRGNIKTTKKGKIKFTNLGNIL